MAKRQCYHCKAWVQEKEPHDCWTTTEEKLTAELSNDLKDAWERIRETAAEFGEQRVYASHRSIMFARKHCYFFVRPNKNRLEICFFTGKTIKNSRIKKSEASSRTKVAHLVYISHRDEVESPVTDWLREAYVFANPDKAPKKKKH
ncbi:MAG: hypothetical protein HYZ71_00565 [Deltaproteobacteria bacterium]|nr:hypothetical protein [Deltaproteobacteria bacterium]